MSIVQAEHTMEQDPRHARLPHDPRYEAGSAYTQDAYRPIGEGMVPIQDAGFIHADAAYDVVSASRGYVFRILKRGARFYCMEFSSSDWPGFSTLYDAWATNVIPRVGKAVADDEESYRYLVESIRRFPRPNTFRQMVTDAGFVRAAAEPMLGGLVTIHSGWKI